MSKDASNKDLRTVERAFRVVETIHQVGGLRLSSLADELDVPKSTAHRYLTTLENLGYLTKNRKGQFEISLEFLNLGIQTRSEKGVYSHSKEKVRELADQTGERVQLAVEEHGKDVLIYGKSGEHGVQTDAHLGRKLYLHTNATGKAILAFLPEDRIHSIIDTHGLPEQTENTITDEDELFETLDEIRDRGISYNHEERILGLRAVGAPIFDKDDNVIGSISISGVRNRMDGKRYEEELPSLLAETVDEIQLDIQYNRDEFE